MRRYGGGLRAGSAPSGPAPLPCLGYGVALRALAFAGAAKADTTPAAYGGPSNFAVSRQPLRARIGYVHVIRVVVLNATLVISSAPGRE
jgi:hypothetical protein